MCLRASPPGECKGGALGAELSFVPANDAAPDSLAACVSVRTVGAWLVEIALPRRIRTSSTASPRRLRCRQALCMPPASVLKTGETRRQMARASLAQSPKRDFATRFQTLPWCQRRRLRDSLVLTSKRFLGWPMKGSSEPSGRAGCAITPSTTCALTFSTVPTPHRIARKNDRQAQRSGCAPSHSPNALTALGEGVP